MSHMVIYRGSNGKPGYHQTEDIHDAVTFVERIRNEEKVEQARIFRLEEVIFEYQPYYRVQIANGNAESGESPPVVSETSEEVNQHIDLKVNGDAQTGVESSNGELAGQETRRGLFGR